MLRTSLIFCSIALAALLLADISITTLEPWGELKRLALGMLTPDFFSLPGLGRALVNTVSFALLGITLAVIGGGILSLFFSMRPVRLFCAFIRAIHELFWAFILMPITGLTSLCGILAIAIPYAGIFAKVYAEIRQEADLRPAEALPPGTSRISGFCYATLPIIWGEIKSYTSYRFECGLRSSAILGFIGLPTIGYHLETAFREGIYSEASALLYCFYLLIVSIRFWAKPRYLLIAVGGALLVTSWEVSFSLNNLIRFLTYDILPWPMRADGYYAGTQAVVLAPQDVYNWFIETVRSLVIPGAMQTLVLTQVALVATALFSLTVFPLACRTFVQRQYTAPGKLLLIVLRTTPEYILAYLFLILWGPSMLPAIVALSLHNGAILAAITASNVEMVKLPFDGSNNRINRYFFEVLPRTYGQFLAFLFYRWEVIMRESAILGLLGVATLGHYIDSAIAHDHLDTALLLILFTALLNMGIDSLSQRIRSRMRFSDRLTTCRSR